MAGLRCTWARPGGHGVQNRDKTGITKFSPRAGFTSTVVLVQMYLPGYLPVAWRMHHAHAASPAAAGAGRSRRSVAHEERALAEGLSQPQPLSGRVDLVVGADDPCGGDERIIVAYSNILRRAQSHTVMSCHIGPTHIAAVRYSKR